MGCEESFITMKLICHYYLVPSLGICIHETPTETGLKFSAATSTQRGTEKRYDRLRNTLQHNAGN